MLYSDEGLIVFVDIINIYLSIYKIIDKFYNL